MVALKTRRRATIRAASLPDDRAVVGSALTAVAVLVLMLLAGTAKAEQPEMACWNLESGTPECESRPSVDAACAAIDHKHAPCAAVQGANSASPHDLPGNTKYTTVQPTQPAKEVFIRAKPHVN